VEYRPGAAENNIYYCCKFLFLFLIFNFGVFGLRYTHPVSFSTTESVGLGFFFFFFFGSFI
jgi:hypothetical protein